jgi:undecaprenol kinase
MSEKKNPFLKSFFFAFRGIFKVLKKERNIKIHLFFAVLAIFLGVVLKISFLSWAVILLTIGVVLSLEIVNSAVEGICNLLNEKLKLEYSETTFIRDASAGAVLVLAIISVFIGLLVFLPLIF